MAKKKACGSRGRWKSGKRKGHCKPKGKASRRRVVRRRKSAGGARGNFCVKIRGKKRSVKCFKSAKAALKAAAKLNRSGANAIVKGSGKMV